MSGAEPKAEFPVADLPAFDADWVLHNCGGYRAIAVAMVESLVTDVPERVAGLATALDAGDDQTACREAHTLKGLAGNGGAAVLRELAQEAESACRTGRFDDARVKLPQLEIESVRAVTEWQAFLSVDPS